MLSDTSVYLFEMLNHCSIIHYDNHFPSKIKLSITNLDVRKTCFDNCFTLTCVNLQIQQSRSIDLSIMQHCAEIRSSLEYSLTE